METITPQSLLDKHLSPANGSKSAFHSSEFPNEWMSLSPTHFGFDEWEAAPTQPLLEAQRHHCEYDCLAVILRIIDKLCRVQQDSHAHALDELLQTISEAISAAERFADCTSSCQQTYLLLYITMFQQTETLYTYLAHRMVGSGTRFPDFKIELKIGDFVVNTMVDESLCRTVLTAGIRRTLDCTSRLLRNQQESGPEQDAHGTVKQSEEINCEARMLESLRTSFDRELRAIFVQ